jgi:hypothetical protein
MGSRTRAVSLLALGVGLQGLGREAIAAPSTPPPPRAPAVTPSTPPPPRAPAGTPPPPTASGKPAGASPFLPTERSGPSTTPPPPNATPAGPVDPTSAAEFEEPEPPQDLSNTWGFSRSAPLQPRYERTDDPSYAAPNPTGFYSGVSVQGNHVPPFPAKDVGAPPAVMTWAGFERAPEGSRVFFQLSAEVAYEVTTKGQGVDQGLMLRVRMRNTKVNVRNNLRHLDLRYFKTPVRSVKVVRKGRDTVATVALKRDAVPVVQIVDGKAGYKLLVLQFSDAIPSVADLPPVP